MMFKFLKRMFGKNGEAAVAAPRAVSAAPAPAPKSAPTPVPRVVEKPVGGVEVASLPLRAILEKLPQELRAIVNQMPDPSVKIVLPVNTILKQLATGAVKMSLASLLRQAPQGTFKKAAVEEKQMVDVPLAEVFKCVDAARLGRRSDQRRYDVPEDVAGLFGRNGTTRSVTAAAETPRSEIAQSSAPAPQPVPAPAPRVEQPKVVRMPGIAPAAPSPANGNGNGNGNGHAAAPVPASAPKAHTPASAPKPQAFSASAVRGELVISFVELASSWPEGIRSELSLVSGDTKLVIPAVAVSAGLQKGRVVFPWSQVRMWLKPGLSGAPAIADDFELIFPLRLMAPAFVAATGATRHREAAEIGQSLPDFFGPSAGKQAKPGAPVIAPVAAPAPAAESAPTVVAAPEEIALPAPATVAAPLKFTLVREEPSPIAEAAPVAPIEAPVARPVAAPHPETTSSPAEIVVRACELPGVAGAVVALEEGLVVAEKLPSGFSADTFAAFMPQIFGRLEKYTAEMQLGAATEITVQSEQGPWHIARRGKIYFGILGRTGERLPESLANLANQLAAHNS
jgi:predicted regulator of Ras-like GTPase activity (Roadblock/LC7/MglB family)